jgi:hypothetical protein
MFALKQEPETAGFWGWFDENEARLAQVAANIDDMTMEELEPVFDELAMAIHELDDRLFAELDVAADGSPVLLITADGDREAMLVARDLVAIAPAYKGWKFSALREREEPADTLALPGGGEIDIREAVFVMEVHGGKAEIAVGLDGWDDARAEDYGLAAEHLVESTLGEADYAIGVSGVMALPMSALAAEADPWPLKALTAEFDKQLGV